MRLSVRSLAELVAVAAVAVGLWDLHRSSRPPGPALKALKRGDEPGRIAALRDLSLFVGAGGGDPGRVVPDLVLAARHDPSPAVRRGALYALTRAAANGPRDDLPIEEALSGTVSPPGSSPFVGTAFPYLSPRAEEVAATLVDRLRTDPDPSVRAFALRGLRVLLTLACEERHQITRIPPGQPVPKLESPGPWAEAAALAVAGQIRERDSEVLGHVVGFLVASRPARDLLDDARRAEILADLVAEDAPTLPLALDLLVLNNLAALLGPDHEESPRLVRLLLDRIARPRVPGDDEAGREALERDARGAYAGILWRLSPSVDVFAQHPEAVALIAALVGGEGQGSDVRLVLGDHRPQDSARRFITDTLDPGMGDAAFGALATFSDPRSAALRAIGRDPRLLGFLWPRVDRAGRLAWLAYRSNDAGTPALPGGWAAVDPLLDDPGARADLTPDEAEAVLSRLLAEPGPQPEEDGEAQVQYLIFEARRLRHGLPESDDAPSPLEAARLLRTVRNLAVLTYFARAADPGSAVVSRLAGRLVGLLGSADPPTRIRAATLLGTLGPAAEAARPALEALAADPDDPARWAATAALRRLGAPGPAPDDRPAGPGR